jgi:hypothetical protein
MERVPDPTDPNDEKFDVNQLIAALRENESAKLQYEILGMFFAFNGPSRVASLSTVDMHPLIASLVTRINQSQAHWARASSRRCIARGAAPPCSP